MDSEAVEKTKKAGEIAQEAVRFAKGFVKRNMNLLDIANAIEAKILELGGKPAFPVNLSINEIAAHATPSWDDESVAYGLLKVDIGVHVDGFIGDTAFSIDLENDNENKKLINAAESGLHEALKHFKYGVSLGDIGNIIEKTIAEKNVNVVKNLSGHSIERYDVHAGITIPNYNNKSSEEIGEGVFAIEPFTTNGGGKVIDGKLSGIYHLIKEGNVRDNFARDVLHFIVNEYNTLPFCSRWIHKKFGTRGLLALRFIEQAGLLHHYPQLIEINKGKVAQAEHSVVVTKKEVEIVT